MADPIYVVTLKNASDLDTFYSDMKSDGFKLCQKRPISRATHYYMTDSQADNLRGDSRVLTVEKWEESQIMRYEWSLLNQREHIQDNTSGWSKASTKGFGWDRDWAKLHCTGTTAQRRRAPGPNENGTGWWNNATQSNDRYVTDTAKIFGDGRHVDVVIVDDTPSYDSQEWISDIDSWDTDGTYRPAGQTRFHTYDWYAELNQYVASIDDDGYGSMSGNYNYYDPASSNTGYHGQHVCGTVAGKFYGWAPAANIYSIDVFDSNMTIWLLFDYIRAFHRHKPINKVTGRRNPTICNHSWGYIYNLSEGGYMGASRVGSVTWQGVTYSETNNPNPSGWTDEGLAADFGISWRNRLGRQWDYVDADVQDLIDDGVVHIGAAGNEHVMQVPKTDPDTGVQHIDWDNRMYVNGYGTVYMCRAGSPNGAHQTADGFGGDGRSVINVGSLESDSDFRKSTFSNYGPQISTFAPGSDIISGVTSNVSGGQIDPKYGGENWWGVLSGTSMASPQVCGIAACLASGADRFTNSDLLGFIQNYGKWGDMSFAVAPQGNNNYSADFSLPTGTDHFIVSGNHRGGTNTNANDPTIQISVGDTIIFNHPGSSAFFYSGAATSASHFEITYIDRTNMFSGATTTSNDPTLNFEVGEVIQIANYQNTTNGTLYIKTTNSTGSGDLVTSGEFQEAFGGFAGAPHDPSNNGWAAGEQGYWYTVNVTPGTYYYQDSVDQSCGGQIIIHATGTYYNHPVNIQTNNIVGGPAVTTGNLLNQGSARKEDPVLSWDTTGVPEGTYYYVHGVNSNMWGELVVLNKPGVLGQAGNMADPTAQKDSPNNQIMGLSPRSLRSKFYNNNSLLLTGFNKSHLKGHRRNDEIRLSSTGAARDIQIYPRTNSLYTSQYGMQWIFSVGAANSKYVMTGRDRVDNIAAKDNPTITVRKGDQVIFDLKASVSGHPLWIGISQQTGTVTWNTNYGTITNNGNNTGTITWDTSIALPGTYYYNCEYHSSMTGTIFVNE